MQLAPAHLAAHLQRGLRALYPLPGDEPRLIQECADQLRAAARAAGYTERSVFTVAGAHFDWSSALAAGSEMSLFGDRQIVELRLPTGKPGKDGSQALQQLAQAAAHNDSVLTLVLLPRLDAATQKSAWFAALEQHGVSVRVDPVGRQALPQWLAQRLAAQQQRVASGEEGQRALAFFADRVEGNLLAAHQEVQKLALLYPPGELSAAQVEAAVLNVARYDAFKLAEAVLAGHTARVQRMLDGLQAEGEAAVLVHWALSEDIRTLARVRQALDAGRPMPMALREHRVWGAKEKLMERVLPALDGPTLNRWLQDAHAVDGIAKGLPRPDWPTDPWDALHRLATQVSRACALRG